MRKQMVLYVFLGTMSLTGCTLSTASYSPNAGSDFVYSVGYYGYRPYWGTPYFTRYSTDNPYVGSYENTSFGRDVNPDQALYGYVSRW